MKTTAQMIEVMQASIDGKEIEFLNGFGLGWRQFGPGQTVSWSWADTDYRIKPEPREWVCRFYSSPDGDGSVGAIFPSDYNPGWIKVREVLP